MSKTENKKAKKYSFELTRLSLFCWSFFLFFLLSWIFVLGILVGRGLIPESVANISDLRNQIKKLQVMVGGDEEKHAQIPKETEEDPELAFYERLATKKNEVKNNRASENRKEVSERVVIPSKPPAPNLLQEEKIVEEPAADKVSPLLHDTNLKYTVQVASIGDVANAQAMVKELVDNGFDAYYYPVKVEGKTYYRIRCGRFNTREEAMKYSRRLEREQNLNGIFVTEIDQ